MGLVNELQESAERDDVLTVLRKAKRVSSKLGRRDLSDWLDHEQKGYPPDAPLPSYRNVSASFCYNTNGYIPFGYGYVVNGVIPLPGWGLDLKCPLIEPIGTIVAWIDSLKSGGALQGPLSPEVDASLRKTLSNNSPRLLQRVTFLSHLDSSQVRSIPEQIKNKILDWACDLEAAGVTGDSQSFSNDEKQTARTVTFNISNSQIAQLTNSGNNLKRM